jgi:hypothetical protein
MVRLPRFPETFVNNSIAFQLMHLVLRSRFVLPRILPLSKDVIDYSPSGCLQTPITAMTHGLNPDWAMRLKTHTVFPVIG